MASIVCSSSSSTWDQRQWRGCRRAPCCLLTLAVDVEAPRGGSARLRLEPRSCHSIPWPAPPYPMKLSAAFGMMTMAMDLERKKRAWRLWMNGGGQLRIHG